MPLNIVSWNVNGLRAALRKGLTDWLAIEAPDIFCIQEVKAQLEQIPPSLLASTDYHKYWNLGERKGYSGVAMFTKQEPLQIVTKFGIEKLDAEGRVLLARYPNFTILNVYFPNGVSGLARLDYKLAFYDDFLEYVEGRRMEGEKLIVCGDFNTAHHEIDLARPKANQNTSGFLPTERAWLNKLEAYGYLDTFRHFNQQPGQYTYWDQKSHARDRNVGWRIDYFYVTSDLIPTIRDSYIRPEIEGSDHCPIGIVADL